RAAPPRGSMDAHAGVVRPVDPLMRRVLAFLLRLMILLLIVAYAVYIWPTRFRYDHVSYDGNTYPVRIDRLTGDGVMIVPHQAWVPVEGDSGENNPETNQPTATHS